MPEVPPVTMAVALRSTSSLLKKYEPHHLSAKAVRPDTMKRWARK